MISIFLQYSKSLKWHKIFEISGIFLDISLVCLWLLIIIELYVRKICVFFFSFNIPHYIIIFFKFQYNIQIYNAFRESVFILIRTQPNPTQQEKIPQLFLNYTQEKCLKILI